MYVLIIGFEEPKTNAIKKNITSVIKSQSSWARLAPNLFVITTSMDAEKFRNRIGSSVDQAPRLIVYEVTNRYWATTNMPKDVTDWLQNNWKQD